MTEPIRPAATKLHGKENWIVCLAIADITTPTATEVAAGTALDITNIAFQSGSPNPSQNTNRVTQERRFGDTVVAEFIGDTTYQGGDLTYAFGAQSASGSDGKKLWEKIPAGTTGYLVRRMGVARATAPAAGQFVDVFPVEFGPSMPTKQGDGESSEAAAVCSFAINSAPAFNKALA
ncbi:hypothetical protein FB382_004396 [Nocardioides ginsengisegetis]|uniref:Phage major tail protein, TP901-1 family n=1 Tax=Nocardioides ginsengisegetis TaxID=661491 RepID=A0A7W3J4I6_9ACTN|nr:hypothetical protein [Nocardioides ginsengisegetis]MBA8806045.1 hypothetical protein [Nocardioides ginsengisegetis]